MKLSLLISLTFLMFQIHSQNEIFTDSDLDKLINIITDYQFIDDSLFFKIEQGLFKGIHGIELAKINYTYNYTFYEDLHY